ncbi:DUF4189 domain-containing protein [Williamsia sp. CHRR-6]|uniref:DUF4189 domain-containing protein n=1 Tax=Williamsia sp. CHRR-6 TaxID=2835871 RepID=UPI001BD9C4B2|nr:DUF4189 domain-containing protein [Williamsia sp. CHRR-6]MBT0567656.1 DUF4189 domain-containing protein [Williamsia sp. CHRR-6]
MRMRKLLAGAAVSMTIAVMSTLTVGVAPANAAPAYWAAIAFSYDARTSVAWNYPTERSAINAAIARCGADCGYSSFRNSCGAVAFSNFGTRYATAKGYRTSAEAKRGALRRLGIPGYVARFVCTLR